MARARWRTAELLAALVAGASAAPLATAQNDVPWRAAVDLDPPQYDAAVTANAAEGYWPISINGRTTADGPRFEAVFARDGLEHRHQRGLSRAQAQAWAAAQAADGYAPTVIAAYAGGSAETYAVASARSTAASAVSWSLTASQLATDANTRAAAGLRGRWITSWLTAGAPRYTVVYTALPSGGWWVNWNLTPAAIAAYNSGRRQVGNRMMCIAGDGAAANPRLSGLWEFVPQPEGGWRELFDLPRADHDAAAAALAAAGFRPTSIAGAEAPGGARYSSTWVSQTWVAPRSWTLRGREVPALARVEATIRAHMERERISAAQLAVTRQGRLVLNRAYTWGPAGFRAVELADRFRTASVAKPEVAVAVLQLVEQGRLSLSDRMVDLLGGVWTDPRAASITVRDLLRHSGGWDRNLSGDPMFADQAIASALGVPLPISRDDILRYMRTRLLDHTPGTGWWYSNFGYMLLGRIVEQRTGETYEHQAQASVWANAGARDHPFVTSCLDPAPDEPVYDDLTDGLFPSVYGGSAPVPWPYGAANFENLASVGSWACSARDLARFTTAVEDVSRTRILSPSSRAEMLAKPPYADPTAGSYYYGMGWEIHPAAGMVAGHGGDIPGSRAEVAILTGGTTYAFVANVDAVYTGGNPWIFPLIAPALQAQTDWPAGDLWRPADFNFDGFVDFFDYADYVGCFEAGVCPPGVTADFNGDGFADFFDYADFVAAFESGS